MLVRGASFEDRFFTCSAASTGDRRLDPVCSLSTLSDICPEEPGAEKAGCDHIARMQRNSSTLRRKLRGVNA